jgi:hypothetical protein
MERNPDSDVLLRDEFTRGLDLERTWELFTEGSFIADDAVVTTSSSGLRITSPGINPVTQEPAFTVGGPIADENDHVKWMAITQKVASSSYRGFDALDGHVLSCTIWARGRTFGTDAHPFGAAVSDPQSDLRLAAFAMNSLDDETGMVFDVWMTNTMIYPFYERLSLPGTSHQGFSSCFPGVMRSPDREETVSVVYDRSAGVVSWVINGNLAATVERIGLPASDATLLVNHGGIPEAAAPRQLGFGMTLFTLMDGGLPPTGEGLVDLGGSYVFPAGFVGGSTVFGQGAEMHIRRFEVERSAGGSKSE